jgi:hypothetical protein
MSRRHKPNRLRGKRFGKMKHCAICGYPMGRGRNPKCPRCIAVANGYTTTHKRTTGDGLGSGDALRKRYPGSWETGKRQ